MTEDTDHGAQTGSLENAALFRRLKGWFRADMTHSAKWRNDAKADFGFYANDQWSKEDIDYLVSQKRQPITFNRTFAILNSVAGTEINGRQETRFIPRGTEDTKVNEVLTAGSQWMADGCDAEDEQSQAFQDTLISGMGWTEVRLDYEDDPEGRYLEEAIDPLEMYWDCKARKKNLADMRRLFRVRRVALSEAREMFPGVSDDKLDAGWALTGEDGNPKSREQKKHRDDTGEEDYDDEVTIVQAQWWEREKYWLIADPNTGQQAELSTEEYETLRKRAEELGIQVPAVEMTKKVYRQAFLGQEILGKPGLSPCKDHFSFNCITGYRDRNKGVWFGLVRVMRDPQMWANKWLSQSLHILNSTAKGGIVAEKDAFDDQRQAEDSYAKPEGITWAAAGAISKGKIMPKPGAGFPTGHMQLMEFAVSSIRDVPGVNLELLGMRDANQPGILEAQRKQAAMTVLATIFDSLRRFRKMVGRIRLYFLQEVFSDNRLIRVVGPDGEKAVPMTKDKTAGKYDVIVDEAPTSPNQKEANWQIIMTILPAFKEQIAQSPELTIEIAKASPLPSALVDAIAATLTKPNPQAEKQAQIAEAGAVAKIKRDEAAAAKDLATAAKTGSEGPAPTGGPLDLQTAVAQLQKIAADIGKVMAETDKIKAETANIATDTAMKPAEMAMSQQAANRQADQADTKMAMDHEHKMKMANKPPPSKAA